MRTLPPVEVTGEHLLARRSTATQGLVTPLQIATRPLLRTGDVLETVPGMLISQHSGEGKANQYYLRGFNLDHGTDFATTVAGIPVNLPTNAHGQGYTDLGFLIPELIRSVEFRKGTYSVEDGDFSSAGSAHVSYRTTLARPAISLTGGEEGYARLFAAGSPSLGSGAVLGAFEVVKNDGPWVHPDGYRKINGLIRYSHAGPDRSWSVTAMGYDGRWNSTDQIPERAVAEGSISRFGTIDPTDGGTSSRYSLSAEFQDVGPRSVVQASAYLMAYRLDLFSNFTYFLVDTVRGDQFEQEDRRSVAGLHVSYVASDPWLRGEVRQTIGVDIRHDHIPKVGLYDTEARARFRTIREDRVLESSVSPFVEADVLWMPGLRTIVGVRADGYHFSVTSSYAPYSGAAYEGIVSPKASLILGPWGWLDLYVNGGYGFHSTDARGARATPSDALASSSSPAVQEAIEHFPIPDGAPVELSPLLVRTRGAELGARLSRGSLGWLSMALWGLDIDSETVFVGDAGLTAPNRPSRRTGFELSTRLNPLRSVHVDVDWAHSRARFRDPDPAGDHIPGAVEGMASAGLDYEHATGAFAGLRVRYFGPRPLVEDNSVRSDGSTVLNAGVGYNAHGRWSITLQSFNILDREVSDVDYFYASRLPREPVNGVDDRHFHPQGPRSIRLVLSTGSVRQVSD